MIMERQGWIEKCIKKITTQCNKYTHTQETIDIIECASMSTFVVCLHSFYFFYLFHIQFSFSAIPFYTYFIFTFITYNFVARQHV